MENGTIDRLYEHWLMKTAKLSGENRLVEGKWI
jgi:hypothetical protein